MNSQRLTGRGKLVISPAALYELPVVVAIFRAALSGAPDNTAFRTALFDFDVGGGQFQFRKIDLIGDTMSLRGRGYVRFDGPLALDFFSTAGRNQVPIPFLRDVLRESTAGLWGVTVRGSLQNPVADVQAAPRLNDALRQFLGGFGGPMAGPPPRRGAAERGANANSPPQSLLLPECHTQGFSQRTPDSSLSQWHCSVGDLRLNCEGSITPPKAASVARNFALPPRIGHPPAVRRSSWRPRRTSRRSVSAPLAGTCRSATPRSHRDLLLIRKPSDACAAPEHWRVAEQAQPGFRKGSYDRTSRAPSERLIHTLRFTPEVLRGGMVPCRAVSGCFRSPFRRPLAAATAVVGLCC